MNNKKFYEGIGSQIRQARTAKHISCEKMGELLGIVKSTYAYYEKGKTRITIDDLITICDYLGLDWNEVINNAK